MTHASTYFCWKIFLQFLKWPFMRCPKRDTFAKHVSTLKKLIFLNFTPRPTKLFRDQKQLLFFTSVQNRCHHLILKPNFFKKSSLVTRIVENAVFWSKFFTFYFSDGLISKDSKHRLWKIFDDLIPFFKSEVLRRSLHFFI